MKLNKIKLTLAAIGMMVSIPALSAVTAGTENGVYDATENTLPTSTKFGNVTLGTAADTSAPIYKTKAGTGALGGTSIIPTDLTTSIAATTNYGTGGSSTAGYGPDSYKSYGNDSNTAVGDGAKAGFGVQLNPFYDGSLAKGAAVYGGAQSTAVGVDAVAIIGGTAIGNEASATGRDSVALGKESMAVGWKSLSAGEDSLAYGARSSAVGNSSEAFGIQGSAFGYAAQAEGEDSTALGAEAEASGENSVALGAGSVADRDNNVSVGSAGNERTISNVAPGVYGTDAVNVNQLKAVERKISAGVSAAMAMTTPVIAAGKSNAVALGAASYNNTSAVALNLAHKFTDDVVATASVSKGFNSGRTSSGSNDDIGIKGSVSWSF